MTRDSMVLFRSMTNSLRKLEPDDFMLIMLSIVDYSMDDIEPEFNDVTLGALWEAFRPQIDANKRKFEAQLENGKKGGRPKKPKETQENPIKPNETQTKPYMRNEKCEMGNVLIAPSSSRAYARGGEMNPDDDYDLRHEVDPDMEHFFNEVVKLSRKSRKGG